jgi:hypothetical protein
MVKLSRGMEADVPLFWSVFMEKPQSHKGLTKHYDSFLRQVRESRPKDENQGKS